MPIAFGAVLLWLLSSPALADSRSTAALLDQLAQDHCASGPWGELKCESITIAPTVELVQLLIDNPLGSDWRLHAGQIEFQEFWRNVIGLSETKYRKLASVSTFDSPSGNFVIRAPADFIEGLRPEQRMNLYQKLSLNDLNMAQTNSFRFEGDTVDEWLAGTHLPAPIRRAVARLTYKHGRYLFFSDLNLVMRKLGSQDEKRQLVKALSREKTMLIKIRLSRDSDLKRITQYWSRGKHLKDVGPILESLAQSPEIKSIDINHLIPSFGRRLVYTYPDPEHPPASGRRDCFWTALNFWSDNPDDRFADTAATVDEMKRNYAILNEAPKLGDILVYENANRNAFHAAVYIASDIVFTKNGSGIGTPWVFMTLKAMREYYPQIEPVKVTIYRRKNLS